MKWVKNIAVLIVSASIVLAGFPVQAKAPCPMMKMQQTMAMQDMEKMPDCDNCPEMQKQQSQKKGKCCDDSTCNAKCSASVGVTMFPASKTDILKFTRQTERLRLMNTALASHLSGTQDRPPKHLS